MQGATIAETGRGPHGDVSQIGGMALRVIGRGMHHATPDPGIPGFLLLVVYLKTWGTLLLLEGRIRVRNRKVRRFLPALPINPPLKLSHNISPFGR